MTVARRYRHSRLVLVAAAIALTVAAALFSSPASATPLTESSSTATSAAHVAIRTAVTIKKASSSRLVGSVTGTRKPTIVTVWFRASGTTTYAKFGKSHVSTRGAWALDKSLRSGTYKATTAGSSTRATSATITVKTATTTVKKPKPTAPTAPSGASAICRDGTYSYSAHRQGTCSWHGGVAEWL